MKRKLKWVVVLVLLGTVFVAASCSKKLINKQKESSNSKLEDKETALKEVEAKYLEKLNEIERLNSLLDSTDKDRQSLLKEKTALENEIEQLKTKMEELKQELEISKWVNANNGNEIFSDEIEDYLDNIYFVGQEEGEEHASFAFEKDNQMGYVFFKEGVEESYLASFTVKPAWQLAYQGEINEKTKITKAQLSLEYLGNKHKGKEVNISSINYVDVFFKDSKGMILGQMGIDVTDEIDFSAVFSNENYATSAWIEYKLFMFIEIEGKEERVQLPLNYQKSLKEIIKTTYYYDGKHKFDFSRLNQEDQEYLLNNYDKIEYFCSAIREPSNVEEKDFTNYGISRNLTEENWPFIEVTMVGDETYLFLKFFSNNQKSNQIIAFLLTIQP